MTDRQVWLFPALDLRSYIKRYPFIFVFSLISVFSVLISTVIHIFLIMTVDAPLVGYDAAMLCVGLGVPFYGLLYLIQESTPLRRFRSPWIYFALGLVALYGLMQYFLNHSTLDLSVFTTHLYLFLILLCVCLTLWENAGNEARQWAYLCQLVMSAAGALVLCWVFSFFFSMIIEHFPLEHFSFFLSERRGDSGFGDTSFLVFILPWYLMGVQHKFMGAQQAEAESSIEIGPLFLYSVMVLVFVTFFIVGMTMLYCAATGKLIDGEYVYVLTFVLGLGIFSFLLLFSQRSKWESWIPQYQRMVGVVAFPILLFTGWVLVKGVEFGGWGDFAFLYTLVGLAWLFAWTLAKPRSGLVVPALGLVVLLGLSLIGPLSVRELSYDHYRDHLKGLFQAQGMFKNGKIVKAETPLKTMDFNEMVSDLTVIDSQFGIARLQDWFDLDLKQFVSTDPNNGAYSGLAGTRLLQALGLSQCDVVVGDDRLFFAAKRGREKPVGVAGYDQVQDFNLESTCPVEGPNNWDEYIAYLSDQNNLLTVKFQGKFIADIPLQKINEVLKAYGNREMFRTQIPPEDLSVEVESEKVKAKVYFRSLNAFRTGDGFRVSGGQCMLLIKQK